MERALCQLRTERNEIQLLRQLQFVVRFFSASFKLHVLCHKKKCSVSVVTTKLVSTAIGGRMEYSSKVSGKEETVYDKVVKEFRELEKNADKYFDNLDAVEEICYQAKKTRKDFGKKPKP